MSKCKVFEPGIGRLTINIKNPKKRNDIKTTHSYKGIRVCDIYPILLEFEKSDIKKVIYAGKSFDYSASIIPKRFLTHGC